MYIFWGEHLPLAKLRPAHFNGATGAAEAVERIVGQVRESCPRTRIIVRAESDFCHAALIHWREEYSVTT